MDYQVRIWLEQAVNLIMEAYEIPTPIEDLDAVVAKMNGKIEEVSQYPVLNTVVKSDDEYDFVIRIMKNQRKDRRNMAIAQNLGTLFLHMGYMSDWVLWNRINEQSYQRSSYQLDFEKDEFACNLLMPRERFKSFILENEEDGEIDTYKIARYFGVPNGVAVKRGKRIGALKW